MTIVTGTLHGDLCTFVADFFLESVMLQTEVAE